jgi:glycosyltransferase involved in cell wall biosynthesis
MNIAFDVRPVVKKQKTGIGYYAHEIIKSTQKLYAENKYVLNFFSADCKKEEIGRLQDIKTDQTTISGCFYFPDILFRILSSFIPIPYSFFFKDDVNLTHFFDYIIPFSVKGKKILTVYDMCFMAYPETLPLKTRLLLAINLKLSCKRADKIITISKFSKKEIMKYLNISSEKIDVVPCGVNLEKYYTLDNKDIIEQIKEKHSLKDEYFLYLGTLEPRKNLVRLIEAYYKLKNEADVPDLVLAGRKGWSYEEIFECIHKLKLEQSVFYIGYISDEDTTPLICGATVFLFPSLYEGFGLPPLEAMACGTPVITSNVSSLPEVVGDAALLVDPFDVDDIYKKMKILVSNNDLREELIKKGKSRVSLFSWNNAAIKLMEIYKQII